MSEGNKLVSLERHHNYEDAWEWEIEHGDGRTSRYRTDPGFEGLFEWGVWGGGIDPTWKQHKGTTQYSLPNQHAKAAYAIARQWDCGNLAEFHAERNDMRIWSWVEVADHDTPAGTVAAWVADYKGPFRVQDFHAILKEYRRRLEGALPPEFKLTGDFLIAPKVDSAIVDIGRVELLRAAVNSVNLYEIIAQFGGSGESVGGAGS